MKNLGHRGTRAVIAAMCLVGVAGTVMAFRQMARDARIAAPTTPPPPVYGALPPFALTRETGESVSADDLRNRIWIADFVFTRCAGPCPRMTQAFHDLQQRFAQLPGIALVSISVDPEYDTPQVLARYARDYAADPARWMFLTGDRDAIYNLSIKGFKLAVDTGEDYEHMILHSTKAVLIDGSLRIRGYYDVLEPDGPDKLSADVRALRREAGLP
ncbi:MAG: SCO family protein [Phycisphaerales bacterium]|nr:SCO family protein [Phycisphaerales bacterium]